MSNFINLSKNLPQFLNHSFQYQTHSRCSELRDRLKLFQTNKATMPNHKEE